MIYLIHLALALLGAQALPQHVEGPLYIDTVELADYDHNPELFPREEAMRLRNYPRGVAERMLRLINKYYLEKRFGAVTGGKVFAFPKRLTVDTGGATLGLVLLTQNHAARNNFKRVAATFVDVFDKDEPILSFELKQMKMWRLDEREPGLSLDPDHVASLRFHHPAEWARAQRAENLSVRLRFVLDGEIEEHLRYFGADAERLLQTDIGRPLPSACAAEMRLGLGG